jgi:hypothetical protein
VTIIAVPAANPMVCLGMGVNDLSAQGLSSRLSKNLSNDLKLLSANEDLIYGVLWDDAKRPGLLVLLSHLNPGDERLNLQPSLLSVIPGTGSNHDPHLTRTALLDAKTELSSWRAEPRPLVLLMACQSVRTCLADLTNFIDTFMGVGAAGIAGTENSVCSDLAARFAESMVMGMTKKGLSLGEVRRSFTLEMLRNSNPLPFSFTVFGSANLKIERG